MSIAQTTPVKRTRDHVLTIRLTEDELQKFNKQFIMSQDKGKAEFIMRLLEESPITIINDIVPLRSDLKKIGTNLNQCARVLNADFYTQKIDINMLSHLRDTTKQLNRVLLKISEVI